MSRWLAILTLATTASAAGLSVRVLDPQGSPIPNAVVSLISRGGERQTVTANAEGRCEWTSAAAGAYLLQAEAPGFEASSPRSLELPASDAVTLTLGVAQIRSTVVVTASGTTQTTDEVAKALTVVDGSTIAERADVSIGDALLDVPGLHVQQLGGPLSTMYFKTRGLRNTDTAVLVDGMRLRDAAGTQADASGMLQDMLLADTGSIEVLRGAGSSLYGTDATGGVVNIVTDQGGGRTRGGVEVEGGSLGAVHALAQLAGGIRNDRVQYSLGLTHWNVTSGLDGDSPARDTSGQGQITLRLSPIAWLTGRGYAGDSFGFVRISPSSIGELPASGTVVAVPFANFIPDTFDPDSTRTGKFFTGALRFSVRPSDRFGFTAQYQNVRSTRDYGDGPAGPGYQPTGSNLSSYLGRIQTANARIDYSPSRAQQLDAGYEFEDEGFRNRLTPPTPEAPFYSDVSQRSHALYAQDQVRLDDGHLLLAAGYRVQFFSLAAPLFEPAAGAPFAGRSSFPAPPTAQTADFSAAYTLRHSGTKIRAHAGRGYRAPSLFERFGSYFDGIGYTLYGDPNLRPDRSNSIDGGIDQRFWNSRAQLSATYYFTRLNEVILFDTSGAITPLTDPLGRDGGYRNTGGGLARGIELSGAVAAGHGLQLNASYTYTDSRQQTPVAAGVWQMFEAPRHEYSFYATERVTSRITALVRYIGTSDYLASIWGGAYRFDGMARVQAMVSYRRPLGEFHALRFYVKGDNLLDRTYYENGFRTPGATATAGTRFEF